jgi:hypothetical protein
MTDLRRFAPSFLPALVASGLLVASCSSPTEDVRITLCKDIVRTQTGSGTAIQGADAQTKGYEYAAVRVRFSSDGRDAQAVCYYNYNAVEDTAMQLADPLSAYATSPYEVVIDGQQLSRSQLAGAVKDAMLKQGREFVDRAKERL